MTPELIANLIAEAGLAEPGVTLFVNAMPADTPLGVLVRMPLAGVPIDHELPGYWRARVQVIVRAPKRQVGNDLANQILSVVTIRQPRQLADPETGAVTLVKQALPNTLPVVYPRSDGNGIEWSINVDCWSVSQS